MQTPTAEQAPSTSSIRAFYERYERWWPAVFFLLGFLYDIWSLDRIDNWVGILKQGVYLSICAWVLGLEVLHFLGRFKPEGRVAKFWKYEELVIHFFLGSLLSEYTLFFFMSASLASSFTFVLLLALVLVLNEFKQFQGASGIPVRTALFSICLVSYFVYLVPVIVGSVGTLTFLFSLVCASIVAFVIFRLLHQKLPESEIFLRKQFLAPFAIVAGTFVLLYFTRLIPPIPVSLSYIGIFHEVKKEADVYQLGYTRPTWKFWQKGDQTFVARTNDRIYCFFRVFSPSRFKDQVQVRWMYDDPKRGWQSSDAIPVPISGGRDEGYRGYTFKSHYQAGDWQVRIETTDGREMGRIYLTVEREEPDPAHPEGTPREVRYEMQ